VAAGERVGIFVATAGFMGAGVAALVISYALMRRLPGMPLVTAGSLLGVWSGPPFLPDAVFFIHKTPLLFPLVLGVLFGGLAFGTPLLGLVFDSVFHLTEEGWRKLTLRWALFFFGLAILNEIVWRTQSTDFWVTFKVFGVVPLTFAFAALQYPLLT